MKKIALVIISFLMGQGLLGSDPYPDDDDLPEIDLNELAAHAQKTNNRLLEEDLILTEQQWQECQALAGGAEESDPTVASNNPYYVPAPANSFDGPGLSGLTQVAPHPTPRPQELYFREEGLGDISAENETTHSVSEQPSQQDTLSTQPNTAASNCLNPVFSEEELGDIARAFVEAKKALSQSSASCICPTCGKSFSNTSNLKSHQRTHTGEKPYTCEQCGKSFNQSSNLRKHERTHTGEKPFSCEQCGECFARTDALEVHKRNHTGESPFTCQTCGKSFARADGLRIHARIHTGEKPFACQHCDKCFTKSGDLIRHIRIHTGEKPYTCKTCGKSFNQSGALREHKRTHTGEKPFACEYCGKSFTTSSDLRRHKKESCKSKPQ